MIQDCISSLFDDFNISMSTVSVWRYIFKRPYYQVTSGHINFYSSLFAINMNAAEMYVFKFTIWKD